MLTGVSSSYTEYTITEWLISLNTNWPWYLSRNLFNPMKAGCYLEKRPKKISFFASPGCKLKRKNYFPDALRTVDMGYDKVEAEGFDVVSTMMTPCLI